MNVHQILSGAGPLDAITREARAFRERFRSWGWGGSDHAARIEPGLNGGFRPVSKLAPGNGDVLIFHHSAGTPGLAELLASPSPKLLRYHNVTPPAWLWDEVPKAAVECYVGRQQLAELVRAVDAVAGVSAFNAAELGAFGASRTDVVPPLIDLRPLGPRGPEREGSPTVLFVGRLSPHKRQDEVIRAFALYRDHHAPNARLVLVGDPLTSAHAERLGELAEKLAPGAVTIESGLSNAELGDRYRAAHAFLCLSEHEGFCIPVLEAFHFGLPVIARPAGAVPETAGNAALLVDDPDLAVVAELVHLAITDSELRAEMKRRGEVRLQAYAPEVVEERLRASVLAVAGDR